MEATLSLSSITPLTKALTITKFPPNPLSFSSAQPRKHSKRLPTIRAAISRTRKEETIETIRNQLEGCYLLSGIKFTGLTVKQLQELRRSLPQESKLIVAKNTLVGKAVEGTPWASIAPCLQGMNAWLFVHTEEIPETLKVYRSFQKEKKLEENDFTGAVFEGKFYAPDEFKALETMPSRAEIYAKVLGALQTPSLSLVSTLQAPARNVMMVLQAYVKKLEEEGGGGAAQ